MKLSKYKKIYLNKSIVSLTIAVIVFSLFLPALPAQATTRNATYRYSNFWFYNDNGTTINNATEYNSVAQSTNVTDVQTSSTIRLRIGVTQYRTNANANFAFTPQIQFKAGATNCTDATGWTTVPVQASCGTNAICQWTSNNFADGEATTQRLTGTFRSGGDGIETGGTANQVTYTSATDQAEWEWMLAVTANAATSTTYTIRAVYSGGVALDEYAVCSTLTTWAGPATFNLSAYRWFANQDSTQVGAVLANTSTPATLSHASSTMRLRLLLHVANNSLTAGAKNFKLQVANKGVAATCSAVSSGNFADVTTNSGNIRYYDNASVADGALLTATSTDPIHNGDTIVNQTYEEQNNFTATSTISAGQDGKWDFSLINFSTTKDTTYCFRVVESDGTLLSGYTYYPEVTLVNYAPTISSATDDPDPIETGQNITFTVDWADQDIGDLTRSFICKSNSFTTSTLTCPGGIWASSTSFATTDPVDIVYTTQLGDIGTNDYFAFTCDDDNACSSGSSGTFTVEPPNSAPTITSATDDPDPVDTGQNITFTVDWNDIDTDNTRSFICKTNSFTSSTLTCPGGWWASSTSFAATDPVNIVYTAQVADIGINDYFAFTCDTHNACSNGTAGDFTVTQANNNPAINSVTDEPDPVVAGEQITFTVNWTDPQSDNTRSFICKTNSFTTSTLTCPGGWWASSTAMAATNPVQVSYTTQVGDAGSRDYYAFVCDVSNNCSDGTFGTFLVNLTDAVSGFIERVFNVMGEVIFR